MTTHRRRFRCFLCGGTRDATRSMAEHIRAAHPDYIGRHGEFIRASVRAWLARKVLITALWGWRCFACGRTEEEAVAAGRGSITIDHIIPAALKGVDDLSNWQPLCWACNQDKADLVIDFRSPEQMRLLRLWQGPCIDRVIGRMHWCDAHRQPMGHERRKPIDLALA